MSSGESKLFQLLPAVYRLRDADQGGQLQNLFAIFEDVLDAFDQDISALYENWFIETCAEWVVPYIGDLLRTRPLHVGGADTFTARAYVAHTLSYRRRKGTVVVLEQLARDVSGWPARAVEFFQLLSTTQYLNHLRFGNFATPDLRDVNALELLGGPFENANRTADVRAIGDPPLDPALAADMIDDKIRVRGKYNVPNIGLFLWRLQSFAVTLSTPCPVLTGTAGRYRFNPLGLDEPLFNQPQTLPAFTHLANEINVPGRLRRRALYDELENRRQAMVDRKLTWLPGATYAVGAEIADSNGNTQRAISGGISGAGPAPKWPVEIGLQTLDNQITWQLVAEGFALNGVYFAGNPVFQIFPAGSVDALWAPLTSFAAGTIIPDSNGNLEMVVSSGKSGAVPPIWPVAVGNVISDGTVVWKVVALGFGPAPPPEQIMICDLNDLPAPAPPNTWRQPPSSKTYLRSSDSASISLPIQVSVDPVLGRIAFAGGSIPAQPSQVQVDYSYGFSGDLGGGPYNRASTVSPLLKNAPTWQVAVGQSLIADGAIRFNKLTDAVDAWNVLPPAARGFGLIAIVDSHTYAESLVGAHVINIPDDSALLIVAADWPAVHLPGAPSSMDLAPNGLRPHVQGNISVCGTAPKTSVSPGKIILNGLLIEGTLTVLVGKLGGVQLAHSTLVPADGGLLVNHSNNPDTQNSLLGVSLTRSICGEINLAPEVPNLSLVDSIIDAGTGLAITSPGADVNIQSSTIFGTIGTATANGVRTLEAGNSIFTGLVSVERTQAGCMRFCFVRPDISKVPRRYHCQPDLALTGIADPATQSAIRARLTPTFTSVVYGDPGYAQLSTTCAKEIRAGADDESEMGAFYFLKQPQRDTNLRIALLEYLRFGLQAGIFYVT